MRVLMISTNTTKLPFPTPPLGACTVASLLEEHGHRVDLLDLCFEEDLPAAVARKVRSFNPDVVGLSVRNIDNFDQLRTDYYLPALTEVAAAARAAAPQAKLLVGGSAVGFAPEALLESTGADVAYFGDAESKLPEVLERLERGEQQERIVNAVGTFEFKRGVRANMSRWLDLGRYARLAHGLPIQTKRGCGRSCAYCNSCTVLEGPKIRMREVDDIIDEMEAMIEATGNSYIDIIDTAVNAPPDHLKQLCQRLIDRGVNAKLQGANFWPQQVDAELVSLMVRAGFYSLAVSVESANEAILAELGRGYTLADAVRTAEHLNVSTMSLMWMFMLGSPGETPATIEESFKFADEHVRPTDISIWNLGLRVHAKTAIARRYGFEGPLLEPTFFSPEGISHDEMRDMLEDYLLGTNNAASTAETDVVPTFFHLFKNVLKLPPPYWRWARFPHRFVYNPLMRTARRAGLGKKMRRLK